MCPPPRYSEIITNTIAIAREILQWGRLERHSLAASVIVCGNEPHRGLLLLLRLSLCRLYNKNMETLLRFSFTVILMQMAAAPLEIFTMSVTQVRHTYAETLFINIGLSVENYTHESCVKLRGCV